MVLGYGLKRMITPWPCWFSPTLDCGIMDDSLSAEAAAAIENTHPISIGHNTQVQDMVSASPMDTSVLVGQKRTLPSDEDYGSSGNNLLQ